MGLHVRRDYTLDMYTVGLDNGSTKVVLIIFHEVGYR